MRSLGPIDVSILIVSYNTRALTDAALTSLQAETLDTSYEVIVVDNASTDGSADMLANHPSKPKLIALNDNAGFARANNIAASVARGKYLLLLNPDTVVMDRAVDRLVAFAHSRPSARIWGGRTVFPDGRLNPASCWNRMTTWRLFCRASGLAALFPNSDVFNGEAIGGWARDAERNVDIVSGCFFLIETALWRGLHGFDPLFFMYGEEADLCLRAHAFSARPVITPTATIVHYGGASERVRADKLVRLLAAKSTLINRHWGPTFSPAGRALLAAWPLSRVFATRGAAAVWRCQKFNATASTWREIWDRRAEWRRGYRANSAGDAPSAEPQASVIKSAA